MSKTQTATAQLLTNSFNLDIWTGGTNERIYLNSSAHEIAEHLVGDIKKSNSFKRSLSEQKIYFDVKAGLFAASHKSSGSASAMVQEMNEAI